MNPAADALLSRIASHEARIGIVGLGYVGLPLAMTFAEAGFPVTGFDVDEAKVADLAAGRSYIAHIADARVAGAFGGGGAGATADFARVAEVDALVICVPTPLGDNREPDLGFVVSTAEAAAPHLRAGQLVVLESTTYPGTTNEVVRPLLEAGGLRAGEDFFLAYSPEREDPGNEAFATRAIPKVVGADDEDALALACALYDAIVVATVPVSSMAAAEATKLTENVFRAVNIALVNELKVVYGAMGIDVWEVIDAAKSKPFGFMPFYPGPGLGGHCIPIDPFYLAWRARAFGQETRFIELAGEINTRMPGHVVDALAAALDDRFGRALDGARILLVGLAYKKNVGDTRESPGLTLIEILEARGARVDYFDPHVAVVPVTREHAALAGRRSIAWDPARLGEFDAALICTDHDAVDYAALAANARLIVDTRNVLARLGAGAANVVKA